VKPKFDWTLRLPEWIPQLVESLTGRLSDDASKMAFVIELARRNVDHGTGGPFAAAVFEVGSPRLVSAGVNVVVPSSCSIAHAEIMALALAQRRLATHDLGHPDLPNLELVSSAQPCIQCYGAIWWSGIDRLVIGAPGDVVERLTGFEEGPLPDRWAERLEDDRSIEIVTDLLADEAAEVLRQYRVRGGVIYNPS